VILAGGKGTRLSEETISKPKPLVEAAGHPLIWHVMKHFSDYGVNEFIVLAGYKGNMLREYFSNLWLHQDEITFDFNENSPRVTPNKSMNWKITVLDTGLETTTSGRLKYIESRIESKFFLTYSDGLSDVNLTELLQNHESSNCLATLTAVRPPARFGALKFQDDKVSEFTEKPEGEGGWINGGFFVLEKEVFEYVKDVRQPFEVDALPQLARAGELNSFKHDGLFIAVDTLRDLEKVNDYNNSAGLPWMT
jgi:glucose-1-phosphate cytidylyltransferase